MPRGYEEGPVAEAAEARRDALERGEELKAEAKTHGFVVITPAQVNRALSAEFAVDVPAELQKDANGLTGVDFKVDATFSDWNSDFSVSAPSGATPLNAGKA